MTRYGGDRVRHGRIGGVHEFDELERLTQLVADRWVAASVTTASSTIGRVYACLLRWSIPIVEMWYPYAAHMAEIELRASREKVFSGGVVAIDDVSLDRRQ